MGPLDPPFLLPGVPEFWDSNESAFDDTTASTPIPTSPGEIINNKNIILNGTQPRFDDFEDNGVAELFRGRLCPWLRDELIFDAAEAV